MLEFLIAVSKVMDVAFNVLMVVFFVWAVGSTVLERVWGQR